MASQMNAKSSEPKSGQSARCGLILRRDYVSDIENQNEVNIFNKSLLFDKASLLTMLSLAMFPLSEVRAKKELENHHVLTHIQTLF